MRRRKSAVSRYRIKEKSPWWWKTASGPHVDYNARLYDPSLGRFLSVDPLIGHPGSTQGINPYSYVANNPLNKTDPTGEMSCTPSGAGKTVTCTNTPLGSRIPQKTTVKVGSNGKVTTSGAGALPDGGIAMSTDGTSSLTISSAGRQSQGTTGQNPQKTADHTKITNDTPASVGGTNVAAPSDVDKTSNDLNPFAVTDQERALAAKGDLGNYWYQRYLQGDPVASIGLAMWGNANEKAMVGLYWDAMGAVAVEDVRMGIQASGQQVTPTLLHSIGMRLAIANNHAIDRDIQQRRGAISGDLSAQQIARYHQHVFEHFRISSSHFGGTPIFGQTWETKLTRWLWCQTCDPSDAPGGN